MDGSPTPAPSALEPAAAPAASPVPATPQPPAGAEPPKPAVEPVVAATQVALASPSPQDGATPQVPHLDPSDPVSIAHHLATNEQAAIDALATSMFKLTPEEVEALETDTVGTIPKLLAKGYVKAQHTMLSQLGRLIPQMIQRHTAVVVRNNENKGKFFSRWPDLKPDLHGALVDKYGATYRAMHPQATMEQMIEDLGPMVMMAAKVVPSVAPAASATPAAPMAPVGANGRPPQPSPFVPAVGGGGAPSPGEEPEAWAAMFADQPGQ